MLRRIASMGAKGKAYQALQKACEQRDVSLVHLDEGQDVPPGTAGIIAAGPPLDALETVLAVGAQHEEIFLLLAEAIGCRESFVPGSAQRMKDHATRFAKALGLDPDDQLTLERGALVHDIGKLKIPNKTLLKDGALDYDEWSLLQQHTHIGADLVKELASLRDIEDIVRRHHECYDGDGYPDRLEGDAIPYLARVFKVMDVYCAMTSPRIYREGQATHKEAIEHLSSERDKHFDPALVDVFIGKKVGRTDKAEA